MVISLNPICLPAAISPIWSASMERPRTGAQEWLRIRLPLVPRPVRGRRIQAIVDEYDARNATPHSGANAVIVTDPDYRPPVSDEEDKDAEGEVKVEPREEEEEKQEAEMQGKGEGEERAEEEWSWPCQEDSAWEEEYWWDEVAFGSSIYVLQLSGGMRRLSFRAVPTPFKLAPFARPLDERSLWEKNIQLGFDGSIIRDKMSVYVLADTVKGIRKVDLFFSVSSGIPIAEVEPDGAVVTALAMINISKGFTAQRIAHLQRRWLRYLFKPPPVKKRRTPKSKPQP